MSRDEYEYEHEGEDENASCTLAEMMKVCGTIALVDVLRVARFRNEVRVRCLETFKGEMPAAAKIRFAAPWGGSKSSSFRRGERCVIFLGGSTMISMGLAGRMPLVQFGGRLMSETFVRSADYLAALNPIRSEGRVLVDWDRLHSYLLRTDAARLSEG